jgi:hypothetical protein
MSSQSGHSRPFSATKAIKISFNVSLLHGSLLTPSHVLFFPFSFHNFFLLVEAEELLGNGDKTEREIVEIIIISVFLLYR